VAQELGVTPTAVNLWVQRYRAQGEAALAARKQGRPRHPSLSDGQVAETTRLMRNHAPDQLELPYALWTREAVGELIQQQWGIGLSQTTVGRYLRAWGLPPQKPAKRAREQCPEAVRGWMEHQYPALQRRAQREGAQIHWGTRWACARIIRPAPAGLPRARLQSWRGPANASVATSSPA
jgi:transposase